MKNLGPDVPLHFTAFHPDFKMLDLPSTPGSTLARARRQALDAGLHHVYTGNVHDVKGQSTYCSNCRQRLIERDWHELGEWNLSASGCCNVCSQPLAGHFDPAPGRWGQRRQRVRIR
jgi:pyruvate formate lyase activating enzyme